MSKVAEIKNKTYGWRLSFDTARYEEGAGAIKIAITPDINTPCHTTILLHDFSPEQMIELGTQLISGAEKHRKNTADSLIGKV